MSIAIVSALSVAVWVDITWHARPPSSRACALSLPGARITTITRFGIAGSLSGSRRGPDVSLMYITGTDTMDAAMKHIEKFQVGPIGQRITCPFLVAHGKDDQQISIEDAKKMFDALGSKDKELKIFTGEDGGAAHCQFDNHLPALLYVSDWLAKKL
jgi:pimeloyl-ACP methyl ester carboxylesterase